MNLALRWFVPTAGAEVCVEANPAGFDDAKIAVLADAGVNRVSLGVQSFEPAILKLLERDHRRAEILSAVERLRPRIPNIGFDLIFGIPGQSVELWQETLDEALRLSPDASVDLRTDVRERDILLQPAQRKANLRRCDEESEREMYALAMDRLPAAGFEQYETLQFRPARLPIAPQRGLLEGPAVFRLRPGSGPLHRRPPRTQPSQRDDVDQADPRRPVADRRLGTNCRLKSVPANESCSASDGPAEST